MTMTTKWAMVKAMVRTKDMFRKQGPKSKLISALAWAMGKALVRGLEMFRD
jgi:hypothetical protein